MVQQIEALRDEVRCRIGVDLAELANDQNVTRDGWIRCIRAASDFEDAVEVILNDAWIPKSLPQLTAFLICITDNIRKTRANVDFVGQYDPSPIGVRGHRKGLTPDQMVGGTGAP